MGLAVAFDWGGLYAARDDAQRIIETSTADRDRAHRDLSDAQASVSRCHEDKARLGHLESQMRHLVPSLEESQRSSEGHRVHLVEVVSVAFEITVFLGRLVSRTASLETNPTAPRLASAIMRLQGLVDSHTTMTGTFISDPNMLNESLRLIAEASGESDEVLTTGRSLM